jgi:hypothetical protein
VHFVDYQTHADFLFPLPQSHFLEGRQVDVIFINTFAFAASVFTRTINRNLVDLLSASKKVVPFARPPSIHDAAMRGRVVGKVICRCVRICSSHLVNSRVCSAYVERRTAADGSDFGDIGQGARVVAKQVQARLALGEEDAVVVGLSEFAGWVILFSEHAESGREIGHQQAGAEVVA